MFSEYVAAIINSTIRSTTPVLFAALAASVCSRVGVFNVALEGLMLIASFTSIAVNYLTRNVLLSVISGMASSVLVSWIVGTFQVRYKAADLVVGTSINSLISGVTIFLLFSLTGVRGTLNDPTMPSVTPINLPVISDIPFLGQVFGNLTVFDFLAYALALLVFIYFFKTVVGYRLLSVGSNREAARSLGINPERFQIITILFSGALCGLGGCALSMGQVTLFTEGMSAGRGWIGMAASSVGLAHPLLIILSSLFFGFSQAIGVALQTKIPSQITNTLPYLTTIACLAFTGYKRRRDAIKAKQRSNASEMAS